MGDGNENKKYGTFKIPERNVEVKEGKSVPLSKPISKPVNSLSDGMFYEIEYGSVPIPGVGKFVLKSQKIEEPQKDETRELFNRMRDIAREYSSNIDFSRFFEKRVQQEKSVIFYRQGIFMKDFTDDYAEYKPLSQYFPCYQAMGYEQLRTYFTWRTKIRQGTVEENSLSYAFLYIYELLNNIGVSDTNEGLKKLMFFWKEFSRYNKTIDKYVLRWLKDYHIYYETSHSFKEFVDENDLGEFFPKLEDTEDNFDLYCSISKYDIRKSKFYNDENSTTIMNCFSFVLKEIKQAFENIGMNYEDILFRPTRVSSIWIPFKEALFYHKIKQKDRKVILSRNEIYVCKDNQWTYSTILTTDRGKQFVGYVMKQMECVLRQITKYNYKLSANLSMMNEETLQFLKQSSLYIDKIVSNAVMEFYKEANKTIVQVDSEALLRIRQEAIKTQNALIVEEQAEVEEVKLSTEKTFEISDIISVNQENTDKGSASDIWGELKEDLSIEELNALSVVLNGEDIKIFADECGIMLEVLVDGINEKAMDLIGDNLMDEEFLLYDDYLEQVKELVK